MRAKEEINCIEPPHLDKNENKVLFRNFECIGCRNLGMESVAPSLDQGMEFVASNLDQTRLKQWKIPSFVQALSYTCI